MAYEKYTTEAIVCGSYMQGEHDRTLRLFTKEAGMLFARASGIRKGESKLRYTLQDFSHGEISLVKGRAEWRVVGGTHFSNFYFCASSRDARKSLLASMRLIRRLMHGGGAYQELFTVVRDGLATLAAAPLAPIHEDLFALRMLHQLGYVALEPAYATLIHAPTLGEAYQSFLSAPCDDRIKRTVEQALAVTHL